MKKGILITFEGNEGCGKSTHIKLLYNFLKKQGHRVFLTREPGGTKIGDGIRELLLDKKNACMTAVCETLLYMASRAQLVDEVIKPKLKAGYIVLCDRWLDATVAYQGYGAGVDIRWIESLGRVATAGVKPRLTVFLDLPVGVGLRRAASRMVVDRMESKKLVFHKKVYFGYRAIAKKEPGRIRRVVIYSSESISEVHEKIKKVLSRVV